MKRVFMLMTVALCSVMLFSSCKKDGEELDYNVALQGKWMVQSISPAMSSSYIQQGRVVEFKSVYRFKLGYDIDGTFSETSWVVFFDRETKNNYITMLAEDKSKQQHEVMYGRIYIANNSNTVYIDYEDPIITGTTYRYTLVREE